MIEDDLRARLNPLIASAGVECYSLNAWAAPAEDAIMVTMGIVVYDGDRHSLESLRAPFPTSTDLGARSTLYLLAGRVLAWRERAGKGT